VATGENAKIFKKIIKSTKAHPLQGGREGDVSPSRGGDYSEPRVRRERSDADAAKASDIINTRDVDGMLKLLK